MSPIVQGDRRRFAAATFAVLLVLFTGGCGDEDAGGGFDPPSNLLQPADLPSSPDTTAATSEPPAVAVWCEGRFESILGPAFETEGVEYTDVDGATVVSTLGREPSATLDRQRLSQVATVLERCATTSPERGLTLLDLGPGRVGFEAPAYDAAQAPAGRVAIAEVDDSYLMVAVVGDLDAASPNVEQLLDAAIDRAAGS